MTAPGTNPSTPPLNIAQLDRRVGEVSQALGIPETRLRRILSALVISQMLPDTVMVKGGMGIKLRRGELGTRATSDLDLSTSQRDVFEDELRAAGAQGWGCVPPSRGESRRNPQAEDRVAFTVHIRRLEQHDPGVAHPQYLVQPYRVTLQFLGKDWTALDVEVTAPEVERILAAPVDVDPALATLHAEFGFGVLRPVRLIGIEEQIAQKLHAVTDPGYDRAHDLVDLQLLWGEGPALPGLRDLCERTFAYRAAQPWPPLPLREMEGWDAAYRLAREETEVDGKSHVIPDLEEVRRWLTDVIRSIDEGDPA